MKIKPAFKKQCIICQYMLAMSMIRHQEQSKSLCYGKGLNEHTNGLIREYFPKHKAFEEITEKEVVEVQNRLNNRPRKVLGSPIQKISAIFQKRL